MSHRSDTSSNIPAGVTIVLRNDTNTQKMKVVSNTNVIEVSSDFALWDTVANKFVKPEDTNLHSGK